MSLVDPLGRSIIHLPPPMESAESRRRDLDLLAAIASQAVVVEWGPWYNTDDGGLPVFVEAVRTNLAGPR